MSESDSPIVYFDGVCNLCNGAVQFVIRHDKEGIFRFASLQSDAGQRMRDHLPPNRRSGVLLLEKRRVESDSPTPPIRRGGKGTPPCQEGIYGAPSSVILYYEGKYYSKSDAALKIARLLGGRALLLMPGYLLPRFIRDAIYDIIAKRRYKWFGRKDECMIPTPELKARFLE